MTTLQGTRYIDQTPSGKSLPLIGNINIPLGTAFSTYSLARFWGYTMQATYYTGTRWLEEHVVKDPEILRLNNSNISTSVQKIASPKAKQYFHIFEAVTLALISSISFFAEKANLKKTVYSTMAAELGMEPDKVSIFSLYKSENPFIRSLRDRFSLQNAVRVPTALLFAKSLTAGIVAFGADVTLERSIFVENNAFDILRNMIFEVQKLRVSGSQDRERVQVGIERAVQRTLSDNHRKPMSEEQLTANRPVFDRLTGDIMSGKFGISESVYVLGDLANHPDHTQKLLSDIEKIESMGLKGFARNKSLLTNGKSSVKGILEQGKRSLADLSAPRPATPAGIA